MKAGSSLLISKLRSPRLRNVLARPRLLERIAADGKRKVVIITAGPGYGKTTFMAQVADRHPGKTVWYQVDGMDVDPVVFLRHLITGVSEACEGIGVRSLERLADVTDAINEGTNVLGVLCDEIAEKLDAPVKICIDDCQLLNKEYAAVFLGYLARKLPQKVMIVMASRSTLSLPIAYVRSQGILHEFRQNDLRFSVEELQELLGEKWGLKLTPKLVRELEEHVDGWAAGLVLMETHLRNNTSVPKLAANHRIRMNVYDYLAEEVLEKLDDDLRDLLMKSALIDPIDAEVLGKSFDISNVSRLFHDAEKKNVFIARLDDGGSYRYHPLFRTFLLEKLAEDHTVKEIYGYRKRLAVILENAEKYHRAVEQYLLIDDDENAINLIEKIGAQLIDDGEYSTMSRWLAGLTDMDSSPVLQIYNGQLLCAAGKSEAALHFFRNAQKKVKDFPDKSHLVKCTLLITDCLRYSGKGHEGIMELASLLTSLTDPSQKLQCHYELCLCYWSAYNDEKFHQQMEQFTSTYEDIGSLKNLYRLNIVKAANCCRTGEFEKGCRLVTEVLECEEISASQRNLYLNNLSSLFFAMGKYKAAQNTINKSKSFVEVQHDEKCLPILLNSEGCLKLATGKVENGEALLRRSIGIAEKQNNLEDACMAYCHLGTSSRRKGAYNSAIDLHAKSLALAEPIDEKYRLAVGYANMGADLVRLSQVAEAEACFRQAYELADEHNFEYVKTQLDFHMAWVFHMKEEPEKEIGHLTRALERANALQHNHFIIQEGRISLPLFITALNEDITPGYVSWVLERIGAQSLEITPTLIKSKSIGIRLRAIQLIESMGDQSSLALLRKASRDEDALVRESAMKAAKIIRSRIKRPNEVISARELQVLELIAAGASNGKIGKKLFISELTVKTHVTNIFRKLGLNTRLEAGLYYQDYYQGTNNNTFPNDESYQSTIE